MGWITLHGREGVNYGFKVLPYYAGGMCVSLAAGTRQLKRYSVTAVQASGH